MLDNQAGNDAMHDNAATLEYASTDWKSALILKEPSIDAESKRRNAEVLSALQSVKDKNP